MKQGRFCIRICSGLALATALMADLASAAPLAAKAAEISTSASREVIVNPVPDWVLPPPAPTTTATPEGAPVRFVYLDNQVKAGPESQETYSAYRIALLKPEALSMGNLTLTWLPGAGTARLHSLRVIRDGKAIDYTRLAHFTILQRESNLEQSMLDGTLTAAWQVPGLQVGDEIEFAGTTTLRDPTLPEVRSTFGMLPQAGLSGAFRVRMIWPADAVMRFAATRDLAPNAPVLKGAMRDLTYELRDPAAPTEAVLGAPPRYNVRRFIELTSLADWPDLSRRLWPVYDKAAQLGAQSPVRAQAARIAEATSDPIGRAEAALRLVEDQVRYVYVGIGNGNLTPAAADVTWERRFGDCKGKTALLIALLRELGIAAEPLLVNSTGDDGLDQRLPSAALFDHVVVRATIAGKSYVLDGTRLGDRSLANLTPATWRWGLPLARAGASLVALPRLKPDLPASITVMDIDASAGFAQPATVKAMRILRGAEGDQLRNYLGSLAGDEADRQLKTYWRADGNGFEPFKVSWRNDDRNGTLVLTMDGEGDLDWEGDATEGRSLDIPGAGFVAPAKLRRPRDQDQTAPWATDYPRYRCWVTSIRLPADDPAWRWDLYAEPVDEELGGTAFWRRAAVNGQVLRTVMSRRTLVPEITPEQAADLNRRLPDFNNNISSVFQKRTFKGAAKWPEQPQPFADTTDWASAETACSRPDEGKRPDDDKRAVDKP